MSIPDKHRVGKFGTEIQCKNQIASMAATLQLIWEWLCTNTSLACPCVNCGLRWHLGLFPLLFSEYYYTSHSISASWSLGFRFILYKYEHFLIFNIYFQDISVKCFWISCTVWFVLPSWNFQLWWCVCCFRACESKVGIMLNLLLWIWKYNYVVSNTCGQLG